MVEWPFMKLGERFSGTHNSSWSSDETGSFFLTRTPFVFYQCRVNFFVIWFSAWGSDSSKIASNVDFTWSHQGSVVGLFTSVRFQFPTRSGSAKENTKPGRFPVQENLRNFRFRMFYGDSPCPRLLVNNCFGGMILIASIIDGEGNDCSL